jgi:transketolase
MKNLKNYLIESKLRCTKYRKRLLDISQKVSALHIGGSFSSCEIQEVIYNYFIKKNKKDVFILSKGHCAIMQYIILEDLKIFKKGVLDTYCQKNSKVGVHPEFFMNGIEASTGSLGHGLAIGAGIAKAKKKNTVYVVVSDGELMEGSSWEAILLIPALKIKNVVLIVDNNDLQSATKASDTHPNLYPLKDKMQSFGWDTIECNGHNTGKIIKAINNKSKQKPFCLIGKTTKGFPVSFMMNRPLWHYRAPNKEEYLQALKEI